ncbi:hypothetical protein JTY60_01580 [symbiont of Argiope bruennichi]|uniref:hypothetical protein n=1 Tax=symbiont of Argiope bruennichi TaxID=2810479 RepID=UPI003DA5CEA7
MEAFNKVKKDFFANFNLDLKIKNFKFTSSDDTKNLSKAPEGVCLNALILWNETSNKKIGSNYNISVNFYYESDFNFKDVINNHYKDYIKIKLFKI